MVSSVIEDPTDNKTERQGFLIGMSLEENRFVTVPERAMHLPWVYASEREEKLFATVPMFAVEPARSRQRELEEEWHTSFEQAIRERAARVSQQLRHLSTTGLDHAVPATDPLPVASPTLPARVCRHWQEHKRAIIFFCLGLGLFLLGFDLMGLLVALR